MADFFSFPARDTGEAERRAALDLADAAQQVIASGTKVTVVTTGMVIAYEREIAGLTFREAAARSARGAIRAKRQANVAKSLSFAGVKS